MTKEERDRASILLGAIIAKCEQYWNESGIGDAEIHVILERIHEMAADVIVLVRGGK